MSTQCSTLTPAVSSKQLSSHGVVWVLLTRSNRFFVAFFLTSIGRSRYHIRNIIVRDIIYIQVNKYALVNNMKCTRFRGLTKPPPSRRSVFTVERTCLILTPDLLKRRKQKPSCFRRTFACYNTFSCLYDYNTLGTVTISKGRYIGSVVTFNPVGGGV